jgi:hypothetical protein
MTKLLSIFLTFTLIGTLVPVGFASPVRLKVDCLCVDKEYLVYGEVQPVTSGGECVVVVDLELLRYTPPGSDPNPKTATDVLLDVPGVGIAADIGENAASLGTGLVSGALSPLGALFKQSRLKDSFINLLNAVFKGHTEIYHKFIDEEIFGAAIAKISSFENSTDLEEYLLTQEGSCSEDGKESNPKPECVIERAMCSYEKYVGVLFHEAGQSLGNSGVSSDNLDAVLVALQNRDQAILDEAQHSQEALDIAIAVYAEFFQTYRLHLRFKELIVHLAKVRAMTGAMHELVGCIPNKFVGIATTKCD